MSSFTNTLTVSPLSDGVSWALKDSFTYYIGEPPEGSVDTRCSECGGRHRHDEKIDDGHDKVDVARGFSTDFASIPRPLWFALPKWGKYGNAAVVHDYLYWSQERSRADADRIMLDGMKILGVPRWQQAAIYRSVRLFGWLAWKRNQLEREAGANRVIDLDSIELDKNYVYRRPRLMESMKDAPLPLSELIHTTVSLDSVNYPDRDVRHRDGLAELTPVSSESDRREATFLIRQGLAGAGSVSFESVSSPGSYLRHQGYRIKLQEPDGSGLFKKDASFTARPGLSGSGASFESVNFPGFYLRHFSFEMWIDDNKASNGRCDSTPADLYHKDASFKIAPGRHQYVDPEGWYLLKTASSGEGESLEGNQLQGSFNGQAFMNTDPRGFATGQHWRFEPNGLFFRLRTRFRDQHGDPDGECLEADFRRKRQASTAHGSAAFMEKVRDTPGQYWMLVPAGEGLFRLQTKFRGPGESLEGNQAGAGGAFLDKTQNVSGQLWKLEKL